MMRVGCLEIAQSISAWLTRAARERPELAERRPEAFPTDRRLAERPGLDDNDQPGLAVTASRAAKWSGRDDDRLEDALG